MARPPHAEDAEVRRRVRSLLPRLGRDLLRAIANLADMAGKVSVTVRAESEQGFDRSKLQNGVIEPPREADLIE